MFGMRVILPDQAIGTKDILNFMSEKHIIDLHCHILPGMDDGSPDVETSLALLRRQAKQGVNTACATSHYYAWKETIPDFIERREQAAVNLYQAVEGASDQETLPRICLGAEVAFFPGISKCSHLDPLCLEQTRTLLLEMPFSDWSNKEIDEVISLVLDRDYQVVLVHPERFCFSEGNRRHLEKLTNLHLAFQVNADTFCSWKTRRRALDLLSMARYPLLGSDCHNLTSRAPHLESARKVIGRKLGKSMLEQIDACAMAWCGIN